MAATALNNFAGQDAGHRHNQDASLDGPLGRPVVWPFSGFYAAGKVS